MTLAKVCRPREDQTRLQYHHTIYSTSTLQSNTTVCTVSQSRNHPSTSHLLSSTTASSTTTSQPELTAQSSDLHSQPPVTWVLLAVLTLTTGRHHHDPPRLAAHPPVVLASSQYTAAEPPHAEPTSPQPTPNQNRRAPTTPTGNGFIPPFPLGNWQSRSGSGFGQVRSVQASGLYIPFSHVPIHTASHRVRPRAAPSSPSIGKSRRHPAVNQPNLSWRASETHPRSPSTRQQDLLG